MAMKAIGHAVRLPIAVAVEVVAQGIRIRLGRSLVTLAGVVCGIAFLASVLTAGVVKTGVAVEGAARAEAARQLALIESESGPLRGRRVAMLAAAAPGAEETRLIAALRGAGAAVVWASSAGLPPPPDAEPCPGPAAAASAASAVLGIGPVPAADWAAALAAARHPVAAALAAPAGLPAGARGLALAWQPRPDEQAAQARLAAAERARAWWVTGIALAVTAIGIANAMLMSVTERFREIGTMKCLGALGSFIRRVFFLESAFLGLVGGLAGALLGALVTLLGYGATYGFALAFSGCAWGRLALLLAAAIAASVALAVGAAIYPATVASRMRPAAALRSSV